jgi:hypothetical protein
MAGFVMFVIRELADNIYVENENDEMKLKMIKRII